MPTRTRIGPPSSPAMNPDTAATASPRGRERVEERVPLVIHLVPGVAERRPPAPHPGAPPAPPGSASAPSSSNSLVDPSMSVNTNVTVPDGCATAATASILTATRGIRNHQGSADRTVAEMADAGKDTCGAFRKDHNGPMTTASITETKRSFSALLDRVKAGETVTITDRGVPVAQIVPLNGGADADWDAHMQRLAREGIVRLPKKKLDVEAFLAMPKGEFAESVLEALIEERRESTR